MCVWAAILAGCWNWRLVFVHRCVESRFARTARLANPNAMTFRLRVMSFVSALGCGALVTVLGCAPSDSGSDGSGASAGGAATGGETTAGGTSTGGATGSGGAVGTGGTGGAVATGGAVSTGGAVATGGETATGGAGTGGTTEPGACPTDAWFCTGFEDATLPPAGASYQPAYKVQSGEWSTHMALQTAVVGSKTQALEVKQTNEFWAMLAVPVQAPTFWARLYVRSTEDLGQTDHNAFFMAMTGDGDQNGGDNVEIAEQYCQVVLNLHDDVVTSIGGTPACGTGHAPLAKDTWHCMEAYFDGPNGAVQVYSDNEKIIDKAGLTTLDFKTFSFGFVKFHGPDRTMYYDDVAVGPTRIGCP